MIFSTFNQVHVFLLFLFFGIIFSIIFNILSVIFLKKYLKIFGNIIFETIFYSIFSIFFAIFINLFNLGQFSIVLLISYILGFVWCNFAGKKLFAFFSTKWYNLLIKIKPKRRIRHAKKHKTI